MSSYVFIGPTLGHVEAREVSDAILLPPVQYGDVYRLTVNLQPRAIGIIDGYFDQVLSVWHKEILWALTQGVQVFGAASMGALRAAELAPFGMRGVGRIFADFSAGTLSDDDEVAVVHGPAELDYRLLSDALADIRSTLRHAVAAQIIDTSTHDALVAVGKRMHYKERSYSELLNRGRGEGLAGSNLDRLADWLPHGRVDQKRLDALAMLTAMQQPSDSSQPVSFEFQRTAAWERFRIAADRVTAAADLQVLDELRIDGELYLATKSAALHPLNAPADSQVDSQTLVSASNLSREHFSQLVGSRKRQRRLDEMIEGLDSDLVDYLVARHLQRLGEYEWYLRRARHKVAVLSDRGYSRPVAAELNLPRSDLAARHFNHLDTPFPKDLASYAARLGFLVLDDFYDAVAGEYLYSQLADNLRAMPLARHRSSN